MALGGFVLVLLATLSCANGTATPTETSVSVFTTAAAGPPLIETASCEEGAKSRVGSWGSAVEKAYTHLCREMDRFHIATDVYTDQDAAGNHFVPSLWYNGGVNMTFSGNWTQNCRFEANCIKVTWNGKSGSDGGRWNGILFEAPLKEIRGSKGGYDLSGATKLTFWARTDEPGLNVKFLLGLPDDSSGEISTRFLPLQTEWTKYQIKDLASKDMTNIAGGFGFVFNDVNDPDPDGTTFYLDEIRYDKSRLEEPRFIVSFDTTSQESEFDTVLRNVAYTYDNSLALSVFASVRDCDRAKLLADAFVYAQDQDRYYTDGRLRNAYQAGAITGSDSEGPDRGFSAVRLPGWWNYQDQQWNEDSGFVGSDTGNLAWAIIGLLNFYDSCGGQQYLAAAIQLGEWIEVHTKDKTSMGGYTGGYTGWEPSPADILWKSTEHNLDLFVAFERLRLATGKEVWRQRSLFVRGFVDEMWNDEDGFYYTGNLGDGDAVNTQVVPMDVQTWALLAFGSHGRTERALSYVLTHHRARYADFEGFDFDTDLDMPWPEGTSQAVVALKTSGDVGRALFYLKELRELQATAANGNGYGIVAAPADGLTTGFDWEYFNRLHIGATSWFIFAELGYNPYWGEYISPRPIRPES